MTSPRRMLKSSYRGAARLAPMVWLGTLVLVLGSTSQIVAGQAAAGAPILNCAEDRDKAVRLSRDLFRLDDKIASTERQLSSAKGGRMDPDAAKQAADARRDLPIDLTLILSKTDEVEAALAKAPLTPAARTGIKLTLEGIRQGYEKLYKNPKAMTDLAKTDVDTLAQKIDALHRLMVDTGSYEKLGATSLENAVASGAIAPLTAGEAALAGPLGGLVLATGVFAIDTIYADETSFQNALDAARAANTLNVLRRQKSDTMELVEFVVKNCGPHETEQVQDSPKPIAPEGMKPEPPTPEPPTSGGGTTPAAPGAEPASQPPSDKGGSWNSFMMTAAVLGGLGGGAYLYAASKAQGDNASCGSAPSLGFPPTSPQISSYRSWCQCKGYSGAGNQYVNGVYSGWGCVK